MIELIRAPVNDVKIDMDVDPVDSGSKIRQRGAERPPLGEPLGCYHWDG